MWGGYIGEGAKTVIPAHASAKVSFRLVADQDPKKILEAFKVWLKENTPVGCRWDEVVSHGTGLGVTLPIDSDYLRAATRALKRASGTEAKLIKSGGSIPVAGLLKRQLGLDTVFMGFGLEDDRLGTLLNAVAQGRTTYGNIRKALHYLLSTNLSEIQVMLAAAVLGLPPPLYPLELLWINFVTDVFPALALAVEPPEPDVLSQPPRSPREPVVRREDWKRLLRESALISTGTLASFGYAFARYGPGKHANTLAFSTLTMAQLLHAYTCRSDRYSAFRRDGLQRNSYLDVAIGASVVAQLGTLFVPPLRRLLGATPITVLDAAVITGGALAPLFLNEWMKPGAAAQRGADGGRERPTPQPQTVISL